MRSYDSHKTYPIALTRTRTRTFANPRVFNVDYKKRQTIYLSVMTLRHTIGFRLFMTYIDLVSLRFVYIGVLCAPGSSFPPAATYLWTYPLDTRPRAFLRSVFSAHS